MLKELRLNIKELRADMNSNTDSFKKGTGKYKEEHRKIRKFIHRDANGTKGPKEQNE